MYYDNLIKEHKKDVALFFVMFVAYICIYGYMSLRLGMGPEEVTAIAGERNDLYIAGGRWGHYIYRQFAQLGTIPFGAGIIAGLYICLSIILQTKILKVHSIWASAIYGVLYLSCIQWTFQLRYSNQCDSIGAAILLISVAVFILQKADWFRVLLSIILITLAISIYQSLVTYAVTLMLIQGIHSAVYQKDLPFIRWAVKSAFVILSAFGLFLISSYTFITYSDIPSRVLDYVLTYRSSSTGYEAAMESSLPLWKTIFLQAKSSLLHYYLSTYYKSHWIMFSIIVACGIILVKIATDKQKWTTKILCAAMVCALMVMPYSISVLMLSHQSIRVIVAEPLLLAGIWGLAVPYITQNGWIKAQHAITFMTGAFFLEAIYTSSEIAANEAYSFERAKEEVREMYERGRELANMENLGECRIVILGNAPPLSASEHLFYLDKTGTHYGQASPYIFCGRGYGWAQVFLYYMRLHRVERGTDKDVLLHEETYNSMPAWPHQGSVRASKGEIIIRVEPHSPDKCKPQIPDDQINHSQN